MQFINQYSFLLLAGFLILVLVIWRLREGFRSQDWVAIAALVAGFTLAFGVFHPTSRDGAVNRFEALMGQGEPVLLSFQSPYCLACMAARPFLDRIETDYPSLQVIRINTQDPEAASLLDQYQFQYTPTFIFFDPQGEELWRIAGAIDPQWVQDTMESLP